MNTTTQTQVTFKIDTLLKDKTLTKIKKEGLTLKALLTMAMRAYLNNDLVLSLQHKEEEPSDFFLESLREAEEDLKNGNTYTFSSADEMTKHLKEVAKK